MTDNNNNVAMNAETPETEVPVVPTLKPGGPVAPAPMMPISDAEAEVPVAPVPAEAEAPAEQKEPKTGTITITITEGEGGHHISTGIEGSFNGMAFVAGLAGAINAISEATKIPGFVILSKLIEVYSGHAADVEEEQDDEDKDV